MIQDFMLLVFVVALCGGIVTLRRELTEVRANLAALETAVDNVEMMAHSERAWQEPTRQHPAWLQPGERMPDWDEGASSDSRWTLVVLGADDEQASGIWSTVEEFCSEKSSSYSCLLLVADADSKSSSSLARYAAMQDAELPYMVLLSPDAVIQGMGHVHTAHDASEFLDQSLQVGLVPTVEKQEE